MEQLVCLQHIRHGSYVLSKIRQNKTLFGKSRFQGCFRVTFSTASLTTKSSFVWIARGDISSFCRLAISVGQSFVNQHPGIRSSTFHIPPAQMVYNFIFWGVKCFSHQKKCNTIHPLRLRSLVYCISRYRGILELVLSERIMNNGPHCFVFSKPCFVFSPFFQSELRKRQLRQKTLKLIPGVCLVSYSTYYYE